MCSCEPEHAGGTLGRCEWGCAREVVAGRDAGEYCRRVRGGGQSHGSAEEGARLSPKCLQQAYNMEHDMLATGMTCDRAGSHIEHAPSRTSSGKARGNDEQHMRE